MKAVDELVWANSQMLGCRGIFTVGLLTGDKDPNTHQAHTGYIGSTDNK